MNPLYEKLIADFLAKAQIERDATLIAETLKKVYPVANLPVEKTIKRFINGETAKPREALLGFMAAYVLDKTQEEVEIANGNTEVGTFFQTYFEAYEEALVEQAHKDIVQRDPSVYEQEWLLKRRKKERFKTIALWILSGLVLAFTSFGCWFWLKKETTPVFNVSPIAMIDMPSSIFPLGDNFNDTEDYDDEKPVRWVTIDSFQISQTEITFDLFDMYCQANKIPLREDLGWGRSGYPAIMMDWYEAIGFCNWLSVSQNFLPVYTIKNNPSNPIKRDIISNFQANGYRLPTEAEWEYAATYDTIQKRKYRFSGSDTAKSRIINFNIEKQTNAKYVIIEGAYHEKTVPAMKSGINQNGLYGMTGNVSEWCHDFYHRHFYRDNKNLNNPVGEEIFGKDTSYSHVLRGGHWEDALMQIRASYRESSPANCRSEVFGFRVVRRDSKRD
jgi:formylglycine-generating enzyme